MGRGLEQCEAERVNQTEPKRGNNKKANSDKLLSPSTAPDKNVSKNMQGINYLIGNWFTKIEGQFTFRDAKIMALPLLLVILLVKLKNDI